MRTSRIVLGVGTMAVAIGAVALWGGIAPSSGDAAGDPGVPVPASESGWISASLDAEGKAAFSDLKISAGEYGAAVNTTVACIRAEGIEVTNPVWSDGRWQYTATYTDRGWAKPLIEACYDQHLRGIDMMAQTAR